MADTTIAPIHCAVDRKQIGDGAGYYALTVNRWDAAVVMLAFCHNHYAEWLQMRNVVCREGWH
jgi:hypothetical protein